MTAPLTAGQIAARKLWDRLWRDWIDCHPAKTVGTPPVRAEAARLIDEAEFRVLSCESEEAAAEAGARLMRALDELRDGVRVPPAFRVGQPVEKIEGYPWPGEVRAVMTTRAGLVRYVVESTVLPGCLHLFSGPQLRLLPEENQ